jgi:hypothetical protein
MLPKPLVGQRTNAMHLPFSEKSQSSSASPGGGWVTFRNSPLVIDMNARP